MIRLVLFIVVCMCTAQAGFAGETVTLGYTARWNGIDLAETEVEIALDGGQYSISIATKTNGLASFFSEAESNLSSEGLWGNGRIQPLRFLSEGQFDGDAYRRLMEFSETGALTHMEADWPEDWLKKWPRADVPDAEKRGPDPVSLLIALKFESLPFETARHFRAFDGRRIVDYSVLCDAEPVADPQVSHALLEGTMHNCQIGSETLHGKRIETEEERKAAAAREKRRQRRGGGRAARDAARANQAANTKPPIIQVQSLAGSFPIPVRIVQESGWGDFEAILTSATRTTNTDKAR